MSLNDTMTSLMSNARSFYQVNSKMSIIDLSHMLKPNPNLAAGSDDCSGKYWANYAADKSGIKFKGLACYRVSGGAHFGPIIKTDTSDYYTYSLFIKALDSAGRFYAKMRYVDEKTMEEVGGKQKMIAGIIPDQEWHHYSFTFNRQYDFAEFICENWPGIVLVAGQKVEYGKLATPYISTDERLITAPEVGGGN